MNTLPDNYFINTDKSKLDVNTIHKFLTNSYWAAGRSREAVEKTIESSFCFGVYYKNNQVGFARVITDYLVIAYLADVFILEPYRGIGLGKKLVETIISYPEFQQIKRWLLATRDAQSLYSQFGFNNLSQPEKYMERSQPKPNLL